MSERKPSSRVAGARGFDAAFAACKNSGSGWLEGFVVTSEKGCIVVAAIRLLFWDSNNRGQQVLQWSSAGDTQRTGLRAKAACF